MISTQTVISEMGVDKVTLWHVFQHFNSLKSKGMTTAKAAEELMYMTEISDRKALHFFLAYGIMAMEKDMQAIKEGKL